MSIDMFIKTICGVAILLLLAIYLAIFRYATKGIEKPIQSWLDSRLRPEKERRIHVTIPGSRLEKVIEVNEQATVWWEMLVGMLLLPLLGLIIGLGLALIRSYIRAFSGDLLTNPFSFSPLQKGSIVGSFLSFTIIGLPIYFQLRRWSQRNTRVIYFTDVIFFVRGKITLLGLLTGKVEDYYRSYTDMRYIDELKIAPDPEDLDPRIKTSWVRDQWTKYWAREKGVASMLIPARAFGGEDFLIFIEDAIGAEQALPLIKDRAIKLETTIRTFSASAERKWEDEYAEKEDPTSADDKASETYKALEVRLMRLAKPVEYDLFEVKDPGYYGRGEIQPTGLSDPKTARSINELFSGASEVRPTITESAQELEEKFDELWKKDNRYKKKLFEADITREEAKAIVLTYGLSIQELAWLVGRGISKEEILEQYPIP